MKKHTPKTPISKDREARLKKEADEIEQIKKGEYIPIHPGENGKVYSSFKLSKEQTNRMNKGSGLSEKDYKKLTKAQVIFFNNDDIINKDAESYLKFLMGYDDKLYRRLWNSNAAIVENLKNKNIFDGLGAEGLEAIQKIIEENILKSGLDTSDPNEQLLFKAVWVINKDCNSNNIKFSPYSTFKKVNDKENYINNILIQPLKFSTSPLYNRFKQFRHKEQKKNNK